MALGMSHGQGRTAGRSFSRRSAAETVVQWAAYLPREERLLLEAVYGHGRAVAEVADLVGRHPRSLRRRTRTLVKRVRSPLFQFVATRREALPRDLQAMARLRVLEGRTLRDTARLTGSSLHRVRKGLREVEMRAEMLT